jgi:hypothetical protein
MTFEESLNFLLSHKVPVVHAFYDRFLTEVPAAAKCFEGVDLKRQSLMLTMGLIVVEAHSRNDYPPIQHYLHVLGDRHWRASPCEPNCSENWASETSKSSYALLTSHRLTKTRLILIQNVRAALSHACPDAFVKLPAE